MRTLYCIVMLAFLAAGLSAEEEKLLSFSEEIYYSGNRKEVEQEIKRLTKRKINFTAQTSFSLKNIKYSNKNITEQIESILSNIKSYEEIPYYSKRHKKTYPLFKNITLLKDYKENANKRIITADITILPFKPVKIKCIIEKKDNFIFFRIWNTENIRWWILPVIMKEKFLIMFSAEIDNNRINCYGLGTADTGGFFIMRSRMKEAFNGRTEAVIRWLYKKLNHSLVIAEKE